MTRRAARGGAWGDTPRAVPARSVRASIAILLLIPYLTGCFHYVPVNRSVVSNGTGVSVTITDRGRVALSERVGSGARRIDGQLVESTDTSVVLSVNSVDYIDASVSPLWTGQEVEIGRDFIGELRERRLSRPRTALMAGLVVVLAVVASTLAIRGFGTDNGTGSPPDDGAQQ